MQLHLIVGGPTGTALIEPGSCLTFNCDPGDGRQDFTVLVHRATVVEIAGGFRHHIEGVWVPNGVGSGSSIQAIANFTVSGDRVTGDLYMLGCQPPLEDLETWDRLRRDPHAQLLRRQHDAEPTQP